MILQPLTSIIEKTLLLPKGLKFLTSFSFQLDFNGFVHWKEKKKSYLQKESWTGKAGGFFGGLLGYFAMWE